METTKNKSNASKPYPAGCCINLWKAVFVNITKACSGSEPDIAPTTPLVDIARGFWFVDDAKIKQCDILVAVEKGIIRGAWEIDKAYGWQQMTATAIPTRIVKNVVVEPGRKYCKLAKEVLQGLKGTRSASVGIRMYGPIRYNFK